MANTSTTGYGLKAIEIRFSSKFLIPYASCLDSVCVVRARVAHGS